MSAIIVFTDVQPYVNISKKCVLGFHDPLNRCLGNVFKMFKT